MHKSIKTKTKYTHTLLCFQDSGHIWGDMYIHTFPTSWKRMYIHMVPRFPKHPGQGGMEASLLSIWEDSDGSTKTQTVLWESIPRDPGNVDIGTRLSDLESVQHNAGLVLRAATNTYSYVSIQALRWQTIVALGPIPQFPRDSWIYLSPKSLKCVQKATSYRLGEPPANRTGQLGTHLMIPYLVLIPPLGLPTM